MRRQFIVDTETTALEPDYVAGSGVIWELALIERPPFPRSRVEHLWRMEPDASKADRDSLRVGRYYERTERMKHRDLLEHDIARTPANRGGYWSHPPALALHIAQVLNDATLICSVPTFDVGFLAAFLRANKQAPTWHYRVRDFASIAYGYLRARDNELGDAWAGLDAGTDDFARALGVDPFNYERHTALGDCRLVADALDVVEGRKP